MNGDRDRIAPRAVEIDAVSKAFGSSAVLRGVSLAVEPGNMVALLGPSGCGKTTLLRIIAGLEHPDTGTVRLGDTVLTGPGVDVPPERRRIGMVFQDWALFPHLSVARNVAYGLPRLARAERDKRVGEALELVGLGGMGDRTPSTLSGGQQQRVALARALAPEPQVLLLDEPFSNLDTALRVQVRTEVHQLLVQLEVTTVFVTHDQEEAFVLGDQVAVMHDGLILQQATPAEMYRAPVDRWVASFVGDANLLPGERVGPSARTALGDIALVEHAGAAVDTDGKAAVDVLIRPEDVVLSGGPDTPVGVVELVEFYGHDTVYVVYLDDGARLRARLPAAPRFSRGDRVAVRFGGERSVAFPR